MRKTFSAFAFILLMLALPMACHRAAKQQNETATMAPATPPPATGSADSDTALTQTMEIGEDRSPNEGGVLSESATAKTSTAPATPVTHTAPKPKPKHGR